jgi:hypothetical protein
VSPRRDRLRGARFQVGAGVTAEVRRSCRNELKVLYEAESFPGVTWEALSTLGSASYLRVSQLNPAMSDLCRVTLAGGALLEGAVGGRLLVALYRGRGRLQLRHQVERVLGRD